MTHKSWTGNPGIRKLVLKNEKRIIQSQLPEELHPHSGRALCEAHRPYPQSNRIKIYETILSLTSPWYPPWSGPSMKSWKIFLQIIIGQQGKLSSAWQYGSSDSRCCQISCEVLDSSFSSPASPSGVITLGFSLY